MNALNRPLLGTDHGRPVTVSSLVYMVRARPGQDATSLCRGLVKRPDLVIPALHEALDLGLIRRVGKGYEVV